MKKRSLFAAVAMLIVSAIVLTSATYAWFAVGSSTYEVSKISATISTTDGTLALQPNLHGAHSNWVNTLSDADFIINRAAVVADPDNGIQAQAAITNGICTTLDPISFDWTTSDPSMYRANHDGNTFTPGSVDTTVDDGYMNYSFNVKLSVTGTAKTVTMTPEFTRGKDFVYALVKVGSTYYLYGNPGSGDNFEGDTYTPLKALPSATGSSVIDNGSAAHIVDDTDTVSGSGSYTLATAAKTSIAPAAITLWSNQAEIVTTDPGTGEITARQNDFTETVTVWVWAEGNDSDCIPGTFTANNIGIKFNFAVS